MEQLVARWAHNPKVVGSSPAPATQISQRNFSSGFFILLSHKNIPASAGMLNHLI